MINNFVFDFGNVLVDYNPMRCILGYTRNISDANYIASEVFASPEWIELDKGELDYERALEIWSARIPERLLEDVRAIVENFHKHLPEKKEMTEIVKRLKKSGKKVYILTNASERFPLMAEGLEVMEYVDGYVASYQEKVVKPSHEIYSALFARFNLKPEECIFIDDSSDNVLTAKRFGMAGYVFDGDVKRLEETFELLGFFGSTDENSNNQ
jgi:putative hydrolase of the HAD superfamily